MAASMWINHAERALQADELCHALAVELGSTDFNTRNIPSVSTLVGCCQGLISVDKEASTVRLIHFTLQEYLFAHPDLFSTPHSAMAEIGLAYLISPHVKALSTSPSPDIQNTPLSGILLCVLGCPCKKGALRLRKLTCPGAIKGRLRPGIEQIARSMSTRFRYSKL